jgi:hypothetical protein
MAFRGRDPFATDASRSEFAARAYEIFGLLCEGKAGDAPDVAKIELPDMDGDTEDAA